MKEEIREMNRGKVMALESKERRSCGCMEVDEKGRSGRRSGFVGRRKRRRIIEVERREEERGKRKGS